MTHATHFNVISNGRLEFKHKNRLWHVNYDQLGKECLAMIYNDNWERVANIQKPGTIEEILNEWKAAN